MRPKRIPWGKIMTVTVDKSTVIENIYKNFYDLIVSITGFTTIVYPEFPDVSLTTESSYPMVILDSPEISWEPFTFGIGVLDGTISVTVYTTVPKDTDQYASDISDKIETSKHTLAGVGLRDVQLEPTDKDFVPHGKIKVHFKTLTFRYKFYFTKTVAF